MIVDLAVSWRPEAELSPEERDAQRDTIARTQDELLGSLDDQEAIVVARYELLPQIALEVDEAGLLVLLHSPLVRTIHLSELDRPNG